MIKRFTFFLMLLFMAGASLQAQTNLFVSASGSDANAGTTWETSKKTLRGALSVATSGSTIRMKVGTYYTNGDTIAAGVTVIGGFATASAGTDTSQRLYPGINMNWENTANSTILDAQHENRVAYVVGHLENCIIRNGYVMGNGAGVYIHGGRVSHCVLIRNRAENDADNPNLGRGGGAYIDNDGMLVNCVLSYNLAVEGLAVAGNGGQQINNTITQNSAIKDCGTVTDVDNHVYRTVQIGTQCWMKENLRATHYADSTAINSSYFFYPGGNAGYVAEYGLLYTPSSFRSRIPQGPCPAGWHIPSLTEFGTLENYVNATYQYRYNGENNSIAKALASTEHCNYSSTTGTPGCHPNGNNTTGFNAIPAGYGGSYLGQSFYVWISSYSSSYYYCYYLDIYDDTFNNYLISYGSYSIRCLKNNN